MSRLANKASVKTEANNFADSAFRAICDQMPAMVALYNIQTGQYIYVNKAVKKLLGYEPSVFMSKGLEFVSSLVHPDDLPLITKQNQKALAEIETSKIKNTSADTIVMFEYRIRHKDGHYVWLHTDGSVFERKKGKVQSLLNISLDISTHKKDLETLSKARIKKEIQDKLKESEQRYQAFISNSREGIWRAELEKPLPTSLPIKKQISHIYKYAYMAEANQAMAEMYGLKSVDQIVGLRLNQLLVEDDPQNTAYLTAFIKSGYNLSNAESHEIDSKGENKYFSNSLVGIIEDGKVLRAWGTQIDVTEARKAAAALKKSEDRLARALQASKLGLWEWDIQTGELIWSDQQKKLFGLKQSEIITYEKYVKMLHPGDAKTMRGLFREAQKTGKPYQIEHRIIWPDGSLHYLLGQGQAIIKDGTPVRMVGTSMNIDVRKKAMELEAKAARLMAERELLLELNKAKDDFISIASHQLRTPATGVKQYLGMILQGHAGPVEMSEEQKKLLKTAYESNERQINIIGDLLRTAQIDAGKISLKKEKIDLSKLLKSIVDDLSQQLALKKQKITFLSNPVRITAYIDSDRMRMAIENLIDNASKYSYEENPVKVTITGNASKVNIKIADKGVGIAANELKKLFQKFSRIDNPLSTGAGGNGLGLYWVKKIVDLHGGKIAVNSAPNLGTTFSITLPRNLKT